MNKRIKTAASILCIFISINGIAQTYQLNANAASVGNGCYQLAFDQGFTKGSAWNTAKINLDTPFDLSFNVYLGSSDGGADGMAFVLQNTGLSAIGQAAGGSMGYGTFNASLTTPINPSLAIEIDTYLNDLTMDISEDHIAIVKNGDVWNNLAGPVVASASSNNVEDNKYHMFQIKWDPVSQVIKVYFDCSLRLSYNYNISDSVFSGNPMVYYGLTAATGGQTNNHIFCDLSLFVPEDVTICSGSSVQLSAGSGSNYLWYPPNGLSNPAISNPIASPLTSTSYTLTYTPDIAGCDTSVVNVKVVITPTITVSQPASICYGSSISLNASGTVNYRWYPASGLNSTIGDMINASPTVSKNYTIVGTDADYLCYDTAVTNITVLPLPVVDLGNTVELCPGSELDLDAGNTGASYHWSTENISQKILIYIPGIYWVDVTDKNNCKRRDSILVGECPGVIYFPNSFTPNDDQLNDLFLPVLSNVEKYYLGIYDLWGELLFDTINFHNGWDGRYKGENMQVDIYVFVAKWKSKSDEPENIKIGHVMLIR